MPAAWTPPPGWPKPPPGFTPPPGWQPDPSWPPPPAGWQFWPAPRLWAAMAALVVPAALLAALAAAAWSGTVDDLHAWRQHSALDARGVTNTAAVLSYSYDPDGGDPDGWTTDDVRFITATGTTVTARIGHHSPGPEQTTRKLLVTYDPQHPTVVRAAGYDDDADEPLNAVVGAVVSLLVSVGAAVCAIGAVNVGRTYPRRRRLQPLAAHPQR